MRHNPGNLDNMQDAVFATFLHVTSTDNNPNHAKYPKCKESWRFYNKVMAAGEEPGSHKDNLGTMIDKKTSLQAVPYIPAAW